MKNPRLFLLGIAVLCWNGCAADKKTTAMSSPALRPCCQRVMADSATIPPVADPPVLALPGDWQDDAGKTLPLSELRGQTVLISMFYASCEGVCVITKNDMKAVEASLTPAAREQTVFVLVTLAPELDTPAVLQTYRRAEGLAAGRWRLLRGSAKSTAALAARLGVGYGRDHSGLFRHASELTVLGPAGNILMQQDGLHADLAATAKIINAACGDRQFVVQTQNGE